jgi:hypothetical protein
VQRTRASLIAVCALAVAALAGCGGGDDEPSTADLKAQLPVAPFANFPLHRAYDWGDPINFVVQGIPLPQSTDPSTAVKVMKDAGFEGAAGEDLERGGTGISFVAARFGSADDARDVQSYVYSEGLKLPCYKSCSEQPGDLTVTGIPGAKGVQQVPAKNPPPDAPPPFTAYGVGFTVGDRFYLVSGGGEPGTLEKETVIEAAKQLYRNVGDSS